jgi:hypothetical protein
MKTLILTTMLALTTVSGTVVASGSAAAFQVSNGPHVNFKPSAPATHDHEGKEPSWPKGYNPLAGPGWGTGGGTKRFPAGQTGIPVNSFRIH